MSGTLFPDVVVYLDDEAPDFEILARVMAAMSRGRSPWTGDDIDRFVTAAEEGNALAVARVTVIEPPL